MLASPINPSDLLFVRGIYPSLQPDFPSSVGFEGVGLVDTLGPNVQGLGRGQRVAVINTDNGSNWAEYAVVPAHMLFPVPDDLSDEQVACFFVNPVTAIAMVRHAPNYVRGSLPPSKSKMSCSFRSPGRLSTMAG